MDRLSTKLTNYILLKGVIEENDFEIYQYGFQRFLGGCKKSCVYG